MASRKATRHAPKRIEMVGATTPNHMERDSCSVGEADPVKNETAKMRLGRAKPMK
jgi:hypothetical protein